MRTGIYYSPYAPDIKVNVIKASHFKDHIKAILQVITNYGYIEQPKEYKLFEDRLKHWIRE